MKGGLVAAATSLLLLPVLVIAAASILGMGTGVTPTTVAEQDIPPNYLALYQAAGETYGVPWEVLAGVGKVECDHGRAPSPACRQHGAENTAGAGGPMQFLAGTWTTYGVDADGDGYADRWDHADAIFGAARYLRASGAPDDLRRALLTYNHANAYVDEVLGWAERYRTQVPGATSTEGIGATATELRDAALANPRIELRPEAALDIRAGRADPRLLAALLALSQDYRLAGVGPIKTGHSHNVAGTHRPSNHAFGRAVDIGSIDGQPVSPTNRAARQLAIAAAALPAALRPDEIGSPFPDLPVQGTFSDRDHQDHVHLGYDR